jgi:hypothetical protein
MTETDGNTNKPATVPAPGSGRRSRWRRRMSYVVAIVASLVIAFVVFTKSRLLPNRVSSYVNEHYLQGTPFEFQCGRITGDYVNRIVIRDPVLRYHGADASFNVFRADEIAVDYRILDVLRFNLIVDDLRMQDVSVQIRRDEDGGLVLPIPTTGGGEAATVAQEFTGRVDVQQFNIDGLQVLFGDGNRELKVRDVNLSGSFDLEDGVGRLQFDRGSAYLTNTETSISSIRLDVEHEGGDVRLRDFVVRLDRSFVMATGGYVDGVLRRLQLVFNPISLDEVHSLGLIPDLSGQFGGNVIVDGPLDSLRVSGQLTGAGLGIAVGALEFDGRVDEREIALDHVDGDFFGSPVTGSFHYKLQGDQDWVFDGSCEGFDLTQGLLPDQGVPATDFNGRVRVEHFAAAGSYLFDAELDSASVGGYRTLETTVRGAWTPVAGLQLDEWTMVRPGYTAEVAGTLSPSQETDMIFRAYGDNLDYFWKFVSVPPIDATVSVSGRVIGPIDDLQINLNGEVRDARFLFAGVDSGRVQADVRGVRGPDPEARVALTGRRLTLAARTFTDPHLRVDVTGGVTRIRDVSFARGDTTFSADLDVIPLGEDSLEIAVHHAAVVHPGEAWRLTRPAHFDYTPRELSVDSLVLSSVAGQIGVSGEYSEASEVVDVSGWGHNVDLSIVADVFGLPVDLRGVGAFGVVARGNVDDPDVTVEASLAAGRVDSLSFDRLDLSARYRGGEYRLERLAVVEDTDSVTLAGWWRPRVSPVAMIRGRVDWSAALGSPFEATLAPHGYEVSALSRALHHPLNLGGAVDGTVVMTGSPSVPRIDVAATVEPREGARFALPSTRLEGTYEGGEFRVARMELRGDIDADINATVPVDISLVRGIQVMRAVPLAVDVMIRRPEQVVELGRYWSRVNVWRGGFHGRVSVRGTIDEPSLGGELSMDDAEIQVAGMVETFRDVSARLSFVDNVAQLTSLSADSDGGGSLRASGSVRLDGWSPTSYRVDVFLNDLWLRSIPSVESQQEGKITIASLEWRDGRRIPNITGAVTVKEATLRGIFEDHGGGPSTITLPTVAPGWVCSIDIDAENNVWVRDPDLRIELGGQLILKRDEQGLYLRGDLEVLRGQYAVYGNKFRIIDGNLDFSTASLRPEVTINAYTPHRVDGGLERRIYLNLDWPRDKKEPELTLSYDEPGYYESDIWRMLGGSVAGGLAANTLERVLNEQMSDVTIEVEQRETRASDRGTAEQEMMIGVGKYLWEDVYLRYRQGLTLETSREVEVEYRLSNMFLIRSELIRHARRSYVGVNRQTLDEFNLDIRLRWEF